MYGKEPKDLLHPSYRLSVCDCCESYVKLYKRKEDGAFEGVCCGQQIVLLPSKVRSFIPDEAIDRFHSRLIP